MLKILLITTIIFSACLEGSPKKTNEKNDSSDINKFLTDSSLAVQRLYSAVKQNIEKRRSALNQAFISAASDSAKIKILRQASERIIKSLTSEQHIMRFSNVSIEKFVNQIKISGDGLYVIGLDYHTGFLLCRADTVKFLHSSYMHPYCVVSEPAAASAALAASAYRVTGSISDDNNLARKWLSGESIYVRTDRNRH